MPFAGYKDFADCVAKNRDKRDPEAYCATIMRQTETPNAARQHVTHEKAEPETAPKANQHTGFWKGHL